MKCPNRECVSLCVVAVIFVSSVIPLVSCSAIPMWEYLSRAEKTSHLYNTFVKQAAEYCKSSTMPDCNKVLLVNGLTNLAKMDDVSLDQMDPYQRGANDRIWESMMKDSYRAQQMKQTELEHERNYYADAVELNSDENYLGSASNDVEESVAGDNDNDNNYMMGPMVVRVRTDGSPIPDDHQRMHLPKDEDMEEHMAMRSKTVPSISELQEFFSPPAPASPSQHQDSITTTTTTPAPVPTNSYSFYDRLHFRQPIHSASIIKSTYYLI